MARGALTFFRLTREDNGITLNIVWPIKLTSGQNIGARWRCSRLQNIAVTFFFQSVGLDNYSTDGAAVVLKSDPRYPFRLGGPGGADVP